MQNYVLFSKRKSPKELYFHIDEVFHVDLSTVWFPTAVEILFLLPELKFISFLTQFPTWTILPVKSSLVSKEFCHLWTKLVRWGGGEGHL